jgi:tetratricopeptide (TPR) repeat protein
MPSSLLALTRSSGIRGCIVLCALLVAAPAAAQDAAEEAWRVGDVATAEALYRERLANDPRDVVALHRLALAAAWSQRYDESLAFLDRLLALAPDNHSARIDRARVLAWRGDHAAALQSLDEMLTRDPSDHEARMTRARVLRWAGRHAAAIAAYEAILAQHPENLEAMIGLAEGYSSAGRIRDARRLYERVRATDPANRAARIGLARLDAWAGRLIRAEQQWHALIAEEPADPLTRVGLAQVLRWQGRAAAAWEALQPALPLADRDDDVRIQALWILRDIRPRIGGVQVHEADSEGNRIASTVVTGAHLLGLRTTVRGDAYLRSAADDVPEALERRAWGAGIGATHFIEPGWVLGAGISAFGSDSADGVPGLGWNGAFQTPARYPLRGGIQYHRAAYDVSRAVIEREIVLEEVTAGAQFRPDPAWIFDASGGIGWFRGQETNRRLRSELTAVHRVIEPLLLGVGYRAFGFEKQLAEGYFAPSLYQLAEIPIRWLSESAQWNLNLETAPGVQRIGDGRDWSGSFRASVRLGYMLAPGREIAVRTMYSTSGVQQIGPIDGSYRYSSIGLHADWRF